MGATPTAAALGDLLPGGWDRGWAYRTEVGVGYDDRFPLPAGCWRVSLAGGTAADPLVFLSRYGHSDIATARGR